MRNHFSFFSFFFFQLLLQVQCRLAFSEKLLRNDLMMDEYVAMPDGRAYHRSCVHHHGDGTFHAVRNGKGETVVKSDGRTVRLGVV